MIHMSADLCLPYRAGVRRLEVLRTRLSQLTLIARCHPHRVRMGRIHCVSSDVRSW